MPFAEKKTILLVEDEVIIALNEANMLKKHGFDVVTAYDAQKAIKEVDAGQIDLILMDIDLGRGKMDGTEAAQVILQKQDIPVVFLSSHTEPDVVEKTEKITAYGYVVKNTGETVLINSIKMAFKLHHSVMKDKENERLMSAVMEASPVAIHGIDPDGKVILWNESSERIFGWSEDEIMGKPLPIIPADRIEEHKWFRKRVTSGEPLIRKEVIRQRKDGSLFYGSLSASPLYDDCGRVFGIVAVMEDITDRKKYERQLKLERDKFQNLMETSPVSIVCVDRRGIITYANKEAEQSLDIRKNGNSPRTYNDPQWSIIDFNGNPFQDEKLPFSIVKKTKEPVHDIKHAIVTKGGDRKDLSINGTPIFDEDGQFDGMIAVLKDVT